MDIMKQIMVLAFDADDFSRNNLNKLSDNELYELAMSSRAKGINVLYWKGLDTFQIGLNCDSVDVDNYWIYFIHKT